MPALVLLVGTSAAALHRTERMLSEAGHLVAASPSFAVGKSLLNTITPDLLVADLDDDPNAGLKFAVQSRREHPDLPAIVTHASAGRLVEAEIERHGTDLIPVDADSAEFIPLVDALLAAHRRMRAPARRWPRKHVRNPLEVVAAGVNAEVVDVSYGGIRLAFRERPALPQTFSVTVSWAGITVTGRPVWAHNTKDGRIWCGVELDQASADSWRRFLELLWTRLRAQNLSGRPSSF